MRLVLFVHGCYVGLTTAMEARLVLIGGEAAAPENCRRPDDCHDDGFAF